MTTTYIGNYYEWTSSGSTQYYYAGATRIAMRRSGYSQDNGLYWLFGDHLGSTSVTADGAGNKYGEVRYKAWGETRYTAGSTPTTFRFTGQREQVELGLYFYNARWYDLALGRFIQADIIVPGPGNSQAWDRYAYGYGNPVKYIDPSGHDADCMMRDSACKNQVQNERRLRNKGSLAPYRSKSAPPAPITFLTNRYKNNHSTPFPPSYYWSAVSTYTPTLTGTPSPKSTPNTLTPDQAADAWSILFEGGELSSDTIKIILSKSVDAIVPNPASAFYSGVFEQAIRDEGGYYSEPELFLRAGTAGFEAVVTDIASTGVGTSIAFATGGSTVETGPGAVLFAVGGYCAGSIVTYVTMTSVFRNYNNRVIFPAINDYLGY